MLVVEAKCHCRFMANWKTEAAWTLKVARLLREQHGATLGIIHFSEFSFQACVATEPSDVTSFLKVVGRLQMQQPRHTVE